MIPVYNQIFTEEDAQAVYKSVINQFVTYLGDETKQLESTFKLMTGRKHVITCSNGTSALHLSLLSNELNGKNVAVPACTFAAVGFACAHANCRTYFVDVNLNDWNINIPELDKLCKKVNIDAVIAVHNYGNPYNYDALNELSKKHNFIIIEDACEALTASIDSRPAGNFGNTSVFSFYGNKIVSGGEGGILVTDDQKVADLALLFRGQAQSKHRRFWHEAIGHNYRITNMQSALIVSQLKRLDHTKKLIDEIANDYLEFLPSYLKIQTTLPHAIPSWWMMSIRNPKDPQFYLKASNYLKDNGFDTRPVFPPMPLMPPWENENNKLDYPNAIELHNTGITLPSGPGLDRNNIHKICELLRQL